MLGPNGQHVAGRRVVQGRHLLVQGLEVGQVAAVDFSIVQDHAVADVAGYLLSNDVRGEDGRIG